MIELNKIYNEDCIGEKGMCLIPDKSIDMILCDLPYGITQNKWDKLIPLTDYVVNGKRILHKEDYLLQKYKEGVNYKETLKSWEREHKKGLWYYYNKIIKDNGAIVLFGSQPFTSALVMSNPKMFKYEWVWDKHIPRNFINAKIMPMQRHENILVFGKGKIKYHPQMIERDKPVVVKNYSKGNSAYKLNNDGTDDKKRVYTHRYPDTIIEGKWEANAGKVHPTQKPVSLMEYLLLTYSDEKDIILDNCMGSGTTAIACINTNRNFIGFEKEKKYFDIAQQRINDTYKEVN